MTAFFAVFFILRGQHAASHVRKISSMNAALMQKLLQDSKPMGEEDLIRASRLLNQSVICANKQAGFLQNIAFDKALKKVEFLIITRGIRGKCISPAGGISALSDEFILVTDIQKYSRRIEEKKPCFVRDTSGLLIGKTIDYAIDEHTMEVRAIEITRGYLPLERNKKVWLFTYTVNENESGELLVPPIHNIESSEQRGGISCDYPP